MFISVHIPKTAGTAFRRHLEQIFGSRICYDYMSQYRFIDVYPPTLPMQLRRLWRRVRLQLRLRTTLSPDDLCIHGHFQAIKYAPLFPDGQFLTWLRDPVERVVSHYHHWYRRPDQSHTIGRIVKARKPALLEFAKFDVMRNIQTRFLYGKSLQDFWFIGIQEHFDDMLPTLYSRFGVEYQGTIAKNVNPDKDNRKPYEIEPELWRQIDALNGLDRRLYEQAREIALAQNWLN